LTIIATEFFLTVSDIEQLLELKSGDVRLALRNLHSVINIPPEEEGEEYCEGSNDHWEHDFFPDSQIFVHHASFCDFLQDSARAGIFYIGCLHQTDLSRHILKAFSYMQDNPSLNRRGHVVW
jgi:hypothetical protein